MHNVYLRFSTSSTKRLVWGGHKIHIKPVMATDLKPRKQALSPETDFVMLSI